jgi:hypothetical protein
MTDKLTENAGARRTARVILRLEATPLSQPADLRQARRVATLRDYALTRWRKRLYEQLFGVWPADLSREGVAVAVAPFLAEFAAWRADPQATGAAGGRAGTREAKARAGALGGKIGGAKSKGGGRPRSTAPRCPCGEMTARRAAARRHLCE